MADTKSKRENTQLGGFLRPGDQFIIAGLALLGFFGVLTWWAYHGGWRGDLLEVDRVAVNGAEVDGANAWQKFWHVTLPELRYVMGAIFLLRLMWTFNKFDDIWLLTGGGFGTNVLPVLTYQFAFKSNDFGKGAANAMIQLVLLIVFLVVYVGIVMRNVEE